MTAPMDTREGLPRLWQERPPHGPWFVSTPHDGAICFGGDKDSAEQCLQALLRGVAQAPRTHWAIEESTPNDGFECYFLLRDDITVGEFSGRQTAQRSRHLQDLVDAANRGAQAAPEPAAILAGAQALANDVWHPPQPLRSLALYEQDKFKRQARLVLEAVSSVPSTPRETPDGTQS